MTTKSNQSMRAINGPVVVEVGDLTLDLGDKEYLSISIENGTGIMIRQLTFLQAATLRNTITRWMNNNRVKEAREKTKNA